MTTPLLDSTTYHLVALHKFHRAALAPRLAALNLHPGTELALAEIWRNEGITHSELARRLGVTRASVTKIVRTLERAGYIQRLGDADDRRVSHLRSTAAGLAVRPPLEQAWREAEREVLSGLAETDVTALRRLLSSARTTRRAPAKAPRD